MASKATRTEDGSSGPQVTPLEDFCTFRAATNRRPQEEGGELIHRHTLKSCPGWMRS